MQTPVDTLVESVERMDRGLLLVITGAGVSLASGIPTFRGSDPGAVWNNDLMELGTYEYFRRDPVGSWTWSLGVFDGILDAEPNPAHHALAALEHWQSERGGRFLLVTQNIDVLHEQAGSRELVKVHGTIDRGRCSRPPCRLGAPYGSIPKEEIDLTSFLAAPSPQTLPRCPECGALVRQHVLWFDEFYTDHEDYQWRRVQEAVEMAHAVIFVGTSLSVGVTELVLQSTVSVGIPVFSIDPGMEAPYASGITQISAKAEVLLPVLCERLGASIQPAATAR